MFYIKKIIAIILSALLLIAFFGCKKDDSNDDFSGGELVVIHDRSDIILGAYNIDTLNPITTKSKSSMRIMNIIYEPLFTLDSEHNLEPVLGESYSLSQDGRSITVNLKNDVKWHDGTIFSASDVVHTLNKLISSDSIYKKTAKKIKNFTALNDNSVLIEFYSPETDFAYLLTFPIISVNTPFITDDSFVPIGTGSYKFSSRTSTELYLEPNNSWHGGQVSEKKIVVRILKDELTATNALNVKEIDAVALENYNQDTNIPKLNAVSKAISTNNMVFLGFNTTSQVMSQNVRRAICDIIDKQKLVDNSAYGKGKICNISINPDSWASKVSAFEGEDADTMMSYEGYKLEAGVYTKDSMPFSARVLVNADNPLRCDIAKGIADMLKASGFETVIETVAYEDYLKKIENDDFDMFVGEVEVLPNINPCTLLDSSENHFNFDISYLENVKAELLGVAERDTIKTVLDTFKNRFYLNPPYLPLYFKSDVIIYGSYVSGADEPNLFDTYKNIEKWYFYDKDGSEQAAVDNGEKTDEK